MAHYPYRELSNNIRRWTRTLGQLRTRALRLRGDGDPSPLHSALEDAVAMCTNLLQELGAADMELQKCGDNIRDERENALYLFDRTPLACVCADAGGRITAANRAAALLLSVSARHLVGQPLLHFTQDRDAFLEVLRHIRKEAGESHSVLSIRPRERRTRRVHATIVPRTATSPTEWLWFLTPERPEGQVALDDTFSVAAAPVDSEDEALMPDAVLG